MAGVSYGGGSSTDQTDRDIGGYPHSGQGNPSGFGSKEISTMLQKQRASGLGGVAKTGDHAASAIARKNTKRTSPTSLDQTYSARAGTPLNDPGTGFGGIKSLIQ
jgi:hypothetical protein